MNPAFTEGDGGVYVRVHVQPRSSSSEIIGLHGDAIKIRLRAPPVDGAANDELTRFLAERLGVGRDQITLVAGASSRSKRLFIRTPAERLATLLLP